MPALGVRFSVHQGVHVWDEDRAGTSAGVAGSDTKAYRAYVYAGGQRWQA